MFDKPGFVAFVVAVVTAVSTLTGGVLFEIVRGYQRSVESRRRARAEEMRSQLRLLYKPILRMLELHSPIAAVMDPEDWDRKAREQLSAVFKVIDEHLEYADPELTRLLYDYTEGALLSGYSGVDELARLRRYVRDRFDQLCRELYIMPNQPRPSRFTRLRGWFGRWMWGRWRAKES
jgi:hypothetical protein